MVAPHKPLEDETDEGRRSKIDPIHGWDITSCEHHDGDIDVAPECAGVTTGEIVKGDGQGGADEEEPQQWGVAVGGVVPSVNRQCTM